MTPRPPRSTLFPYTTLFRSALIARLGPRIERALRKALPGLRHDERFVVLQDGAEAVAPGAGTPRVVERKQDRRERGRCRAAVRARGVSREATAVAVVERDGNPLAFVEGGGDRAGDSPPRRSGTRPPAPHHEDFLRLAHPLLGIGRVA